MLNDMGGEMDGQPQQDSPRAETDELFPLVYEELRGLARAYDHGATVQATALVHEAYGRLAASDQRWNGREHFLAVAARAMRQVFVDYLRSRGASNRPDPARRVTLVDELHGGQTEALDFLDLHVALERLEAIKPRYVRLVELRFFGGLTEEESARVLNISPRTVKREWRAARAWLALELPGRQQPGVVELEP